MKILRLALSVGPTSPELNQFTLPVLRQHEVTLCTFFACGGLQYDGFRFHEGNGRILSFLRVVWQLSRRGDFDLVHVHSPHLGLMLLAVALVSRPTLLRRTVMHLHSSYRVYRPRNRWMLLPSFICFARLVCCGSASQRSFPRLYRWLAGNRLVTIHNGVNLPRVNIARPSSGLCLADSNEPVESDKPLRLMAVGRMRALKNHSMVIRALAETECKDITLTVLGGGAMLDSLRHDVRRAGMKDRVHLAGELPRDEVLRQLWNADGFVSMSTGEGMPMAVLEAMACHCPVILSDIPPHREIAESDKGCVRLVDLRDVRSLIQAIDRWADLSIEERTVWGSACRKVVARNFSLRRMHDQFDRMIGSLSGDRLPAVLGVGFRKTRRSEGDDSVPTTTAAAR